MAISRFKKGQSGNPKGRPKGCLDKKNRPFAVNVRTMLEQVNCNPIEILAAIANGDLGDGSAITPRLRMEASAELAQYVYPKLKSVEHKGDSAAPVQYIVNMGPPIEIPDGSRED